jgi:hypothetical protein
VGSHRCAAQQTAACMQASYKQPLVTYEITPPAIPMSYLRSKDRVSAEYASPTDCCNFDQAGTATYAITVAIP